MNKNNSYIASVYRNSYVIHMKRKIQFLSIYTFKYSWTYVSKKSTSAFLILLIKEKNDFDKEYIRIKKMQIFTVF